MSDMRKSLEMFSPKEKNGKFFLTLPAVMHVCGTLLKLCIMPHDTYYIVACTDDLFEEANGDQQRYFDIFTKHDSNYHYDVEIRENMIYKRYDSCYNVVVAVNELLRFFILFDDFIMKNDVIGNEDQFEEHE